MTFEKLSSDIENLSKLANVDTTIIGKSIENRPIYAFHLGNYGDNQIIITGAIHAREWITALLVTELVKYYDTMKIPNGGIYFLPLTNPDGVKIALETQPLYKANAAQVDLNVNFDADWGKGLQNVRVPGPENYIGPYPASEPEVTALVNFTTSVKPKATISYHSKGEVIYYGFEPITSKFDKCTTQKQLKRTKLFAQKVGELTGYTPIKTKNSTGGYSDWVFMNFGIPTLTIEVGNDNYFHPITKDKLPEIFEQNKDVPKILLHLINLH